MPDFIRYWNCENFEGLKDIAKVLESRDDFRLLADYCRLREQGLRIQAFYALQDFIDRTRSLDVARQRQIACELARLHYESRFVHQFFAKPLATCTEAIFRAWCDEGPDDPAPYRWLGLVCKDTGQFEKALAIDPYDAVSLSELAAWKIERVELATHHINQSLFLGSEDDAEKDLADAAILASKLPQGRLRDLITFLNDYYSNLLKAWRTYRSAETDQPFRDWYAEQKNKFDIE